MSWSMSMLVGLNGWLGAFVLGDVQQSTYHIAVTSSNAQGATINPGPLAGLLPQMNTAQQWVLSGIALLIVSLLGLLIKLWWQSHQRIKEQS